MSASSHPSGAALSFLAHANNTYRDWPDVDQTLHALFERQALMTPHAVALRFQGAALTYRQLQQAVRVLAARLQANGVRRGDTVALMIDRSFELVIAMLATLRAGAAYVPMDASLPRQRMLAMLADCQPAAILQQMGAEAHGSELMAFKVLLVNLGDLALVQSDGCDAALPICAGDDLAYVIFTSGSTGVPKGAMNDHCGVVNRLLWMQETYSLTPEDVVLQKTPYSFDVSVWEFFWPLITGARLVIAKPGGHLDPYYLHQLMVEEGVTVTHFVPTMLRLFIEAVQGAAPNALRLMFCSGEALPLDLMRKTLSLWPGTELHNLYGPTECAVDVTFWDCRKNVDAKAVLIGSPVANTRIYVLDAAMQPVPPGEVGEIFIAGLQVGRGYVNRPELTTERFLSDPFLHLFPQAKGKRMYRTGDLGRWLPGQGVEYLGRVDFQVKIGGVRIELEEIEAALMSSGVVSDAVVITRQNVAHETELVAGVVASAAVPLQTEEDRLAWKKVLRQHITGLLPGIMVPGTIQEIRQIPLTTSGKADRRQLAADLEILRSCEPGPADTVLGVCWETTTQRALAEILAEYLPSPPTVPEADFLKHGGTSMIALLVSAAIRKRMGREIKPVHLLRYPQLRDLALEVDQAPHARVVMQVRHTGEDVPLTEHQKTLIMAGLLDDSGAAMLVHVPLLLDPRIKPDALLRAFAALWQRHPMFRISAHWGDGQINATLLADVPAGWWRHHGQLPTVPVDLDWSDELLSSMHRPLLDGAATRVDVWTLPDDRLLVIWTVHHFAIDEASTDHCLNELDRLLQGQTLPPVVGSTVDFVTHEQRWMDHEGIRRVAREVLDDLAGSCAPFSVNVTSGHELGFELPELLQTKISFACAHHGCTPFPLLLAGFGLALQEIFGRKFNRVLAPFSRRVEPELLEPVGYFLDVRFLEVGRRATETRIDHLARVKSAVLAAMEPSFQPLDQIAADVAAIDPMAARALGAFAMTWRHDSARQLVLGGHQASLLRYPHRACKFGLTLHAALIDGVIRCSIEAVDEAFESALVEPLHRAFVSHLSEVVELDGTGDAIGNRLPMGELEASIVTALPRRHRSDPVDLSSEDARTLTGIWREWTSVMTGHPRIDDDFLKAGGSSLKAIRMAMQIREAMDVPIQVGAFLANPVFGALLMQIEQARNGKNTSQVTEHFTIVGEPHAQRLLLLVPGHSGHAVGLMQLAQELLMHLGSGHAIVIVDLDPMLQTLAGDMALVEQLVAKVVAQVMHLESTRFIGLVGFSLGGQLVIQVAKCMLGDISVPIYLLDTYAPRSIREGLFRRLEAALVRRVQRLLSAPPPALQRDAMEVEGAELDLVMSKAAKARWQQLDAELLVLNNGAPQLSVHLIQAGHSMWYTALLRRRSTNGLDGCAYRSLQTYRIPAHHLELPKAAAGLTARIVAATING